MIKVVTEHPVAVESLDHIAPYGTVRDNNSNQEYIESIFNYFGGKDISVLDLGCAGGQLVSDFVDLGATAVGIEGSTNVLSGAGADNWKRLHNKNLFFADLTKPYSIKDDTLPMDFDFIHSWEVIEHIEPMDLDKYFKGVRIHLADHGVFCGSIALYPSYGELDGKPVDLHRSQFNPAHWLNIFYRNGFELCEESWWPPMPQKYMFPDRKFDPAHGYDVDADEGVVLRKQGLFFGYVLGDAMYRNHDSNRSSIYFCLRLA